MEVHESFVVIRTIQSTERMHRCGTNRLKGQLANLDSPGQ